MDWSALISAVLSTQTPALPVPGLERSYLVLSWALVLASAMMWGLALLRFSVPSQRLIGGLVLLWCLWPGTWSPAYWLGLAFRAPSMASVLLAGWLLWQQVRGRGLPVPDTVWGVWAVGGVLLGWLLLLDTFAVWPLSIYALGFSPLALGGVALLLCGPWLLRGSPVSGRALLLPLGGLLVYALLRLPTGNLWDALLDPWLWCGLHLVGVRLLWCRWRRGVA